MCPRQSRLRRPRHPANGGAVNPASNATGVRPIGFLRYDTCLNGLHFKKISAARFARSRLPPHDELHLRPRTTGNRRWSTPRGNGELLPADIQRTSKANTQRGPSPPGDRSIILEPLAAAVLKAGGQMADDSGRRQRASCIMTWPVLRRVEPSCRQARHFSGPSQQSGPQQIAESAGLQPRTADVPAAARSRGVNRCNDRQ